MTLDAVTDTQYEYIGDGGTDGTIVGKDSTYKLAFYGGTPAIRAALTHPTVATTEAAVATTYVSSFGFTSSTATLTVVNLLNEIRAKLVSLGLTA
jgi:hypothetical protein